MNAHTNFSTSPFAIWNSFKKNHQLIWQMTKREVIGRYKGTTIGLFWTFINPLLMLTVYTFVFSVVFKARWGGSDITNDGKAHFAIMVFTGMIVHTLFSEVLSRAPNLILNNVNYVKKVVFPLEILPFINIGAALFHMIISLLILLIFIFALNSEINWEIIFIPLLLTPLIVLMLGLTWILASVGTYIRDIGQSIGIFITILMFLSPVFYPATALPEEFQNWILLNPLTFIIEQLREIVIFGKAPKWGSLINYSIITFIITWLSFAWFQKTRKGFADVL